MKIDRLVASMVVGALLTAVAIVVLGTPWGLIVGWPTAFLFGVWNGYRP